MTNKTKQSKMIDEQTVAPLKTPGSISDLQLRIEDSSGRRSSKRVGGRGRAAEKKTNRIASRSRSSELVKVLKVSNTAQKLEEKPFEIPSYQY